MFFSGAFCSAHAQLVVDNIEVAAEFQPHLMQGAGAGEAEFLMQANARRASRLRTETAGVVACHLATVVNEI